MTVASAAGASTAAASTAAAWTASAAGGSSAFASAGASLASAGAAFLAARFFGVVAPSLGSPRDSFAAASKIVFLSVFGSATRRVPSWPGRPLNFCQSPVTLRMAATGSVG